MEHEHPHQTSSKSSLLIRGTGTVGFEVAKRLAFFAKSGISDFCWDEMIIGKHSPLKKDVPRIRYLREELGWKLCVEEQCVEQFTDIGLKPDYTLIEAVERSRVVLDATRAGGNNLSLYEHHLSDAGCKKVFIAEGSEFKKKRKFGDIFLGSINEWAILRRLRAGQQFFVVGSCNSHGLARNIRILIDAFDHVFPIRDIEIEVTILRRSDDPNKERASTSFAFSLPDKAYLFEGSYHVYNALQAFKYIGYTNINVHSRLGKLADPFMHCMLWKVVLPGTLSEPEEHFFKAVTQDPFCATTNYTQANIVYWESKQIRDPFTDPWFVQDRCYAHTVICLPTVRSRVIPGTGKTVLEYGTFTPQDSNVILPNLQMISMARDPFNFDVNKFSEFVRPLLASKEI